MRDEIILIGPMDIGKSTISELLSVRLNSPHIKIDQIRFKYYEEIGYSRETEEKLRNEKGFFNGTYRYWKPFELYAIKKILNEYSDCIFDFGAGHSVYEDDKMFDEAKELLADFKNVILLLPSKDIDESLKFYKEQRNINDIGTIEILRHFMTHHSNYDLCKHIIYVKDKSKDEVTDEVCAVYNIK